MDKPSVLIIDDEELLLKSFSSLLERDYNVLTATNGREGLLKFKSNSSLSMVLLDLHMPVTNGVETLKAIRELDDKIKVVIMTGNSSHEWAVQCANIGVQGYIEKPIEPEEMLARMKKLIPSNEDNFFHNLWGETYPDRLESFSPLVRKTIKLVDRKFGGKINREGIASKLNISPEHLSKTFKKDCGLPLSRYINERRIHESKILLNGRDSEKISHVARKVGLTDANYFSKIFKKHTGISPKEYIKKTDFS